MQEHRERGRLAFLAEAGKVLASSLDYRTTLKAVAELVVPFLADWCVVDVVGNDGLPHRLALAVADPAKLPLAEELQRRYKPDPDHHGGVELVISSGEPQVVPEISEAMLVAAAQDAAQLQLLRALGLRSSMILPLQARGRILGAITLVEAQSGRHYGPDDLTLATELATRSALAIDNALLYREANRLATIVAAAPDPILVFDRVGRIQSANPASGALLGWAPAELVGRGLDSLVQPGDLPAAQARLARIWAGESLPPQEAKILTRSGALLEVLSSAALLSDEAGEITGLAALIKDITPLQRARARLHESLNQLELLLAIGQGLLSANTQQELFTVLVEGLVGRFGYDAVALLTVDSAGGLELQAYSGTGAPVAPGGLRFASCQELAVWAADRGLSACIDLPVVVRGRTAAVISAMSHRHGSLRAEHRSALTLITHRLALNLERLMLLEEVQAKNEEMEAFVYAASHDLRSPLINVLGFSQELQSTAGELLAWAERQPLSTGARAELASLWEKDIQPALRFIGASVHKMEALVDGLLVLSRIGRQSLQAELVAVDLLLGEVLDSMQAEITAAGASVEAGPLPPVVADRGRLSQVFANLIGNAIKYADPSRPCRVTVTGEGQDGWCRYCVADNGIGIAPQHAEQIFRPFHRLDPGDGRGGHGLGLSIVERIVRRHGGRLQVESAPGEGSRFCFEMPRRPEQ